MRPIKIAIAGSALTIFSLFCTATTHAQVLTVSSYSMQNGESGFTTYHDDTYNGSGNTTVDGSFLSGGTGQLTDGVLGTNDIFDNGVFDWVGWTFVQPVITFTLDGTATLDTLSFRTANNSSLFNDVGVFGAASVSFSNDGLNFSSETTYFTTDADRTGNESRWVDIPLNGNVARFVRVQLLDGVKVGEGAKPWIFISEAQIVGTAAAPEPGSVAFLTLVGLPLFASLFRYRWKGGL